jgi:transcriptional regulator with GAF, ATPase, and Fis domain
LSLSGQAKLLHVLQGKEFELVGDETTVCVDVHIVAITNAALTQVINECRFWKNLCYQLNAFPSRVPPLRERKEDIPLLVHHFLTSYTASLKNRSPPLIPRPLPCSWTTHGLGTCGT